MMKNFLFVIFFTFLIHSCKTTKQTKITFLDEYVLADSIAFKGTVIGGLSGVDFTNNEYYFVVDDDRNPRILTANITISNDKIKSLNFKKVMFLNDSTNSFYKENTLDLESVFVDEITEEIYLVSEGSIYKGKLPKVFKID
jgi:hypothetical protein